MKMHGRNSIKKKKTGYFTLKKVANDTEKGVNR
jgi:hypothetical protein